MTSKTQLFDSQSALLAEILQSTSDLNADMSFLVDKLGFRLEQIYPSDDPAVAVLSGHGIRIRLDKNTKVQPATLQLEASEQDLTGNKSGNEPGNEPGSEPGYEMRAPNGMRVLIKHDAHSVQLPITRHKFEVRRLKDSAAWVIGRAGMHYRDLIPDRLGGSIIASHIRIPNGGPVPDMVHFHSVGFQLIYCYRGWVRLVYEDQGEPFVLHAGDCVTQPPQIRHRVLEASDKLEVVEIAVPAEHMTTIDHDMELPTGRHTPERHYQGQTFCHHRKKQAQWRPWRLTGFESRDTGVAQSSGNVASVHVLRCSDPERHDGQQKTPAAAHDADIYFGFVLEGSLKLVANDSENSLVAGDAFVLPPGMPSSIVGCSPDLQMLEVALPGQFHTTIA